MMQESKQWTIILAATSAFHIGYNLTIIAPALLIITKTLNLTDIVIIMIG